MSHPDDDEATTPRRINRNMRIREERVHVVKAQAKWGELAREQYPPGTSVKWVARRSKPTVWGFALDGSDLIGPYVRVRENFSNEVHVIEVDQILNAGDYD